ncbi:MAG TPA: hypothetical protein VJ852_07840 [Gemmatimonadaceae bacterium]|nr:hypothetical protein [Gemmatimonadaceae bacterium]
MPRRLIVFGSLLGLGLLIGASSCQSRSALFGYGWMPRPRLQHVGRAWSFADSAQWKAKRDSILTAVVQLGGEAVTCQALPADRRFANALYWRYNAYYLKIRAQKMAPPPYWHRPWVVSLEGYSLMPFECRNRPA